ncbi:MAG: sulfatase-like hydrolase/transferase [Chloroflexota bacterium]
MQKKPNILLIMSDNHGTNLLGSYGNDEVQTPRIDRLAGEGIQFNQAYCVNGMCSPCRASVLTGLMPSQHGIHSWIDDRLPDNLPAGWNALEAFETLPEILKRSGYNTALIGKYHLGDSRQVQNGFDHWVAFPHGHTVDFWNNQIFENGETYQSEGHSVDFFTDKALEYLDQQGGDNPFFLFLPYNGPYGHWPCIDGQAKHRFGHLYDDCPMHSAPREPLSKETIAKVMWQHANSGNGLDYSALLRLPNNIETLRNYYSQMTLVDDSVGRVLDRLEANGQAENTLVIYTVDHGFSTGSHGFWGHSQATWPANTHAAAYHMPIIMRQPGVIEAGTSADQVVSQLDLFPTLAEIGGATLPTQPSLARSLSPILSDPSTAWENEAIMEQEETRGLRSDKWLYMSRFQGNEAHPLPNALYDLENDPDERVNLIDDPAYQPIAIELEATLQQRFDEIHTPEFDLWRGGRVKSNSDKPWFWQGVWGADWAPIFT